MAVAKGFKQTEIGTIPEDWECKTLGSIGTFKNGINKDSSAFGTGDPFVNLLDVFGVKAIAEAKDLGLIKSNSAEKALYNLIEGDILFVRSSVKPEGVGLTAVIQFTLPDTIFSGFLIRFRESGYLTKDFKRHCFYDAGFRKRIVAASSASANTNINQENLKKLTVLIPPKEEQEAIANALSDADALIESLEKLIAKKRLIKKGAMQELLTGKRRLPGYSKVNGYKESEIGFIPRDWHVKLLPEVCKFRSGKAHESFVVEEGAYICVNSKFISTDGTVVKYSSVNLCLANKDDILMVMSDLPNGRALAKVFISNHDNLYAVNQRVCALSVYKDDAQFIGLQLNRNPYFLKFDDGVSQTHLLNRVFEKCPVLVPESVSEQKAISGLISDMESEITRLEVKLLKARLIKQGMMQALLTGRIRLI